MGIKGKAGISSYIEFPNGIPIDYMHLVCLGLFKSLFKKWFDSKNKAEQFYFGTNLIYEPKQFVTFWIYLLVYFVYTLKASQLYENESSMP